jgi:hypothetical protein
VNHLATAEVVEGFVLVVDDDPTRRAARLENLVEIGRLSVLGARSYECHEVAHAVRPDAIVLEPDGRGGIFPAIRDVLVEDPRVRGLIFGYERAQQARLVNPELAHRRHGVSAPARAAELHPLLRKRKTSSRIGPFTPADCVQAAGTGKHAVTLECVDPGGVRQGSITMSDGRVRAAETDTARGFEAFAWLVTRFDARVIFVSPPAPPPPQQPDLADSWQTLMLEAMRQHDRDRRPGQAPLPVA